MWRRSCSSPARSSFLMRAETRSREEAAERAPSAPPASPRPRSASARSAIVVAVVATPLLPQPPIGAARRRASAPGGGIDATLQLGDDLRRPAERSRCCACAPTLPAAPYLRATTLSRFDGAVWDPDRVRSVPLDERARAGDVTVDADIRVTEYTTTIEVNNLVSPWLPVPYPAVERDGPRRRLGGRALQPHGRQRSESTQRPDATRS